MWAHTHLFWKIIQCRIVLVAHMLHLASFLSLPDELSDRLGTSSLTPKHHVNTVPSCSMFYLFNPWCVFFSSLNKFTSVQKIHSDFLGAQWMGWLLLNDNKPSQPWNNLPCFKWCDVSHGMPQSPYLENETGNYLIWLLWGFSVTMYIKHRVQSRVHPGMLTLHCDASVHTLSA